MAIGKTELVGIIAEKCEGVKKKDVEAVVTELFEAIIGKVASGDDVTIPGFGKFDAVDRAAREGVNPATGEKISIPEKRAPRFKSGEGVQGRRRGG